MPVIKIYFFLLEEKERRVRFQMIHKYPLTLFIITVLLAVVVPVFEHLK